jgi:hypothetical protein
MHRSRAESVVLNREVRTRFGAVMLGLLVVFAVFGFDAARHSAAATDRRPATAFIEQQHAAVAPAEVAPTETGLSRSQHPPPLAYFVIVGCALAIAARRVKARRHRSARPSLEHFFAFRRGPPLLLAR